LHKPYTQVLYTLRQKMFFATKNAPFSQKIRN